MNNSKKNISEFVYKVTLYYPVYEYNNPDLEYVDNMSLWLDIKIFFWSIVAVFKKTNAEISENGIKDELTELREQKENVHG